MSITANSRIPRKARRLGFQVMKSREWKHVPYANNHGEFMLIDNRRHQHTPIIGWNYDATLEQIETFLEEAKT